jgi:hypothetical protein
MRAVGETGWGEGEKLIFRGAFKELKSLFYAVLGALCAFVVQKVLA